MPKQTIIGIDPGYGRVGIAVIEGEYDVWTPRIYDCIETDAGLSFVQRLSEIEQKISSIIDTFDPTIAAVETLFFNANTKTAIQVSQARGVILHILHKRGIIIREIGPLEVKQAITGYGRATKPQVQKLLSMRLRLETSKIQDDAADALAAAFACGLMFRSTNRF